MTESEPADKRPRPQFGEYATPEQQRAAIRVPASDNNEPVPVADHTPPHARAAAPGTSGTASTPSASQHVDPQIAAARRRADRLATYILLGVGLLSVLSTIPTLLQLPQVITDVFDQFGIDAFTQLAVAQTMAWILLAVQALLWVLALVLSLRAIKRERTSWWIPFVIGVVANLVLIIGISLTMVSDPAFTQYVNSAGG